MKQEIVSFELLTPVTEAKDVMHTTMNNPDPQLKYFKGRDRTIHTMMLGLHSPLNAVKFKVKAWVTDRCHSHLRTHKAISNTYWCGSSREELTHGLEIEHEGVKFRLISFHIDMKAYIEIARRRKCASAHKDIRDLEALMDQYAFELVPELEVHAGRPCVFAGMCTEPNTDCGFINTGAYQYQRTRLLDLSNALRRSADTDKWKMWKDVYVR